MCPSPKHVHLCCNKLTRYKIICIFFLFLKKKHLHLVWFPRERTFVHFQIIGLHYLGNAAWKKNKKVRLLKVSKERVIKILRKIFWLHYQPVCGQQVAVFYLKRTPSVRNRGKEKYSAISKKYLMYWMEYTHWYNVSDHNVPNLDLSFFVSCCFFDFPYFCALVSSPGSSCCCVSQKKFAPPRFGPEHVRLSIKSFRVGSAPF